MNRFRTTDRHIALFALVSLIVHGVVLGHGRLPFTLSGQAEHTLLSVRLIDDTGSGRQHTPGMPSQAATPATLARPPSRSRHNAAPLPPEGSKPSRTALGPDSGKRRTQAGPGGDFNPPHIARRSPNAQPSADRPAPATVHSAADPDTQAQTRIRSRLKTELARHFSYPHVARLRGWEGSVLLAFRIEMNGRLERIRVAQSSGFAVLDRSALDSLAKVDVIPEAVAWLDGHDIDMHIPVIYRLEGPF